VPRPAAGFGKVKEYTGTGARIMKMPGLYNYTAPEVLRSEPATVAADVYSFGAILWELASKARPFDNMDQMGMITHVGFGQQRLATPAGADPRFGALIGLISSCAHPTAAERAALADAIQLLATVWPARGG
jgi:serine/threonine protein kinase